MLRGKQKVPQFTIGFSEKKFDKVYQGFDLDYIFKYSDEIPSKCHIYRAQYIVRLAREAEEAFAREKGDNAAEDGDINWSNETESITDNVGASGSDVDCDNDHAENNINPLKDVTSKKRAKKQSDGAQGGKGEKKNR